MKYYSIIILSFLLFNPLCAQVSYPGHKYDSDYYEQLSLDEPLVYDGPYLSAGQQLKGYVKWDSILSDFYFHLPKDFIGDSSALHNVEAGLKCKIFEMRLHICFCYLGVNENVKAINLLDSSMKYECNPGIMSWEEYLKFCNHSLQKAPEQNLNAFIGYVLDKLGEPKKTVKSYFKNSGDLGVDRVKIVRDKYLKK